MKKIIADKELISYCGLYCGACKRYLKKKCPGCVENEKASWCKVRTCCLKNHYKSCVVCKKHKNVKNCKKFNNFLAKAFGCIFGNDRTKSIKMMKEHDCEHFAKEMAKQKRMTPK